MTDLLQILAPILLVDVLNPVLLGVLIFAASSDKPVANSTAILIGHTLTYFLAGYGLSFGVEKISALMQGESTLDYVISGVLGVFCIYWGLTPNKPSTEPDKPEWQLTPLKCFGLGIVLNAIGLPFAIPYFGAIDQILKADISLAQAWTTLTIYNLAYALPFALVPGSILLMGKRSETFLEKLSASMEWLVDEVMPWLIVLLGLWLIYDAIVFFI